MLLAEHNDLVVHRNKVKSTFYEPYYEYVVRRPGKKKVYIRAREVVRMPRSKKLLWLDLLVSGFYRQATGVLIEGGKCDGDKRCCLGVIADACPKLKCEVSGSAVYLGMEEGPWNKSNEFLNTDLQNWLGITEEMQRFLASMNDERYSFEDIAFTIDAIF